VALRGRLLTPTRDGLFSEPDGLVLAGEGGDIVYAGKASKGRHRGPVRDVRPAAIVPGFVDTHLHFPQTRIIGRATGPLLAWLATSVFPEEAQVDRPAYARAVAGEMIDRMIAAGTTTAAIFSSSSPRATEVLFAALAERGLRALAGLVLMDAKSPKALKLGVSEAMRAAEKLIVRWHGHDGRLSFAVTPRFALSCSRKMLEAAGSLAAAHDLPIQTHVGETPDEWKATKEVHGWAKHYVDVYEQTGLLTERTVLAHAIHLSKTEWQRIAARGASIAHCPDSNLFLGSGRMQAQKARRLHIAVGLGSDVAAGRSFSMRRAMSHAYDNALGLGAPLSPAELFRMATLEGAEALGLDAVTGSLEVGKNADLVVIDVPPAAKSLDEVLAHLVFETDDLRVRDAYVRGRRLELAHPPYPQ
jgi:guanine deaminase